LRSIDERRKLFEDCPRCGFPLLRSSRPKDRALSFDLIVDKTEIPEASACYKPVIMADDASLPTPT